MNPLETAKAKLEQLLDAEENVRLELRDAYDLDSADDVYEAADQGEIVLSWREDRDIDYATDGVNCQKMLVGALELLASGDKKAAHNADKTLEVLVHEARRIRKGAEDDARKAQEIITLMNEILAACDQNRK